MGLAILARLFCCGDSFLFGLCVFGLCVGASMSCAGGLLRGRRSAGKSACATCLEDFVLVVLSFAEAG